MARLQLDPLAPLGISIAHDNFTQVALSAGINLGGHTTDELPEGSTNLYSQWEVNTYTNDFVQPRTTTQGLVVGNDLHSSVSTAFNAVNSVFNGDPLAQNGGINYFVNLAYGTGFSGFGGLFVGGRANGSPGTPTQTLDSNWTAGYTSAAFTNTNTWEISGASHLLPGLFFMAAGNVTTGSYTPDIYIGGLITRMITLETDTNAIKFNEAQLDSDITFYNDTGTTLTMDGATGLITVGNSISFPSGQGIDWAGTNNDMYANTGTGIVTVRGVNGVNLRLGTSATDIFGISANGGLLDGDLLFALGTARTVKPVDRTDGSGAGYALTINGGAQTAGTGAGGALNLNGGGGFGASAGGAVVITGGGSLTGGAVTINGGTGVAVGAINIGNTRGAVNISRSGGTVGFFGVTATTRSSAYTPTNVTSDRSYDANATTIDELADVLGTLIADLQLLGLIG